MLPLLGALFAAACAAPAPFEIGGANVAQVHEYIGKDGCDFFIRRNRPACVSALGCFPVGTDVANMCSSTEMWQWQNFETGAKFAPGVLPMASHRENYNGGVKSKIVWTYVSDITQGEAVQNYNIEGSMTVEDVLNTPTNHISMISNMLVNQSKDWFRPGMYSLLIYSWFVVRFSPRTSFAENGFTTVLSQVIVDR